MIILAFYKGKVDYKALRLKVDLIGNNLGLQYPQRLELRKVLRIDEKRKIILLSLFSVES
jgi:hypothetical protein